MSPRYASPPRSRANPDDRLAAYSAAAAGALLALTPSTAEAQVVYTDVDPNNSLTTGDDFLIDFDEDGNDDVLITLDTPFDGFFRALVFADETNGGGVVGRGPVAANYSYFYASVLDEGAMISDANTIQNTNVGDDGNRDDFLLASTFGGTPYGDWGGETDKFIGVSFIADVDGAATTHYAWIRLDVADATDVTVKDYAYESTPDTAIEAGDTGDDGGGNTAVEPGELADGYAFTPVSPNPTVGRSEFDVTVAQTEVVRVEVFDTVGRSVGVLHDGALAGGQARTFALDGGALPAGVYVVRVTGESFDTTRSITVLR